MGTGFLNSQGCFYFNSSSDVLEEVTLTNVQVTTIASQQDNFTRLAVRQNVFRVYLLRLGRDTRRVMFLQLEQLLLLALRIQSGVV